MTAPPITPLTEPTGTPAKSRLRPSGAGRGRRVASCWEPRWGERGPRAHQPAQEPNAAPGGRMHSGQEEARTSKSPAAS